MCLPRCFRATSSMARQNLPLAYSKAAPLSQCRSYFVNVANKPSSKLHRFELANKRLAFSSTPIMRSAILTGREDRYDGIILDPEQLPHDPETFSEHLSTSLKVTFWS